MFGEAQRQSRGPGQTYPFPPRPLTANFRCLTQQRFIPISSSLYVINGEGYVMDCTCHPIILGGSCINLSQFSTNSRFYLC